MIRLFSVASMMVLLVSSAFPAQLTTPVLVSTNQKCSILFINIPTRALSCDSVSDSFLKAYYRLDEPNGTALDSKGSNSLSDNNGTAAQAGVIGDSREFTAASNQRLSIADNSDLTPGSGSFSVGAWFRFGGTLAGTSPGIVSKWTSPANQEYVLFIDGSSNRVAFDVSSDGANMNIVYADSFGNVPISSWHYALAWRDATANTLNIQIDNGNTNTLSFVGSVFHGSSDFTVGSIGSGFSWTGQIDEVFFTKRVLTASERQALYNMGLACRPSGL